ncbi:hypothetical protein [Rhizobium jaguaris]|uniref:Uncharacterized protein n=1 Tax=Rhizobium jaguaris TaxID=1312183 RepID=A0A387FXY7_9HYPH|nr:hypothetical protein [Rhizobium jaguaris]AYG59986.1 hypothetical protein CCGE525_15080 [Rhizobium jaguaris]
MDPIAKELGTEPSQSGRLEIVVPEETLVAGQDNAINFIIRNPFSVPISVTEVAGPSSQTVTAVVKDRTRNGAAAVKAASGFLEGMSGVLASISLPLAGIKIETQRQSNREVNVIAQPNSKVKFDEDVGPYTTLNITAEEGSNVEIGKQLTEPKNLVDTVIIPPGSERIFTVFVRTTHWLLFTPRRFPVNIQLGFELDGRFRSQVVAATFSINPPLGSILLGSIFGGSLGALARSLQTPADIGLVSLVQGAAAVVMSIIASITLSRKTGAQSFITVEDFFGAFAIGALIGYGGSEYFRRAIMPGSTEHSGSGS